MRVYRCDRCGEDSTSSTSLYEVKIGETSGGYDREGQEVTKEVCVSCRRHIIKELAPPVKPAERK